MESIVRTKINELIETSLQEKTIALNTVCCYFGAIHFEPIERSY